MLFDFDKSKNLDNSINKETLYGNFNDIKGEILGFVETYEKEIACKNEIEMNDYILFDVLKKAYDDLLRYCTCYNPHQYINMPDHFKEAAHIAYWIRRLKPFSYRPHDTLSDDATQKDIQKEIELSRKINENIAIEFAQYICTKGEEIRTQQTVRKTIPLSIKEDFLYIFRYKHISPHSLMIILRTIYT
ncbi:hypothetical protein MCHI_002231 [Candidatus Magnetoovum chiemensis]|nr:hypothetical protein MCHI_002231 [Candidatus Magnetoovum chiemensis]